ncbi:hypothetical protein PL921460058 [Planktothrix tepida PCC 9214]|uniref:Uncharacterized protein n=1 Tax=Planktothrix tepida PCC 9214 TaxID=671072 RepID=A0A1J1LN04_9CYAN|nr:hypothetical protein PL921460058 [Planktothrix tepida PCC 9214]
MVNKLQKINYPPLAIATLTDYLRLRLYPILHKPILSFQPPDGSYNYITMTRQR